MYLTAHTLQLRAAPNSHRDSALCTLITLMPVLNTRSAARTYASSIPRQTTSISASFGRARFVMTEPSTEISNDREYRLNKFLSHLVQHPNEPLRLLVANRLSFHPNGSVKPDQNRPSVGPTPGRRRVSTGPVYHSHQYRIPGKMIFRFLG